MNACQGTWKLHVALYIDWFLVASYKHLYTLERVVRGIKYVENVKIGKGW